MKSILLTVICTILFIGNSFAQGLPHYMTEQEKELYDTFIHQRYYSDDVTPPPTPVRTMAEWEELQALMITWTSFQSILAQVVHFAQNECLVYIVCNDSNSVKTQLTSYGVPHINLRFIIAPYNSIWCRDYGPWTAYTNNIDSLKIIDWKYNRPQRPLDDQIPVYIAQYLNVPIYQAISYPNDFIATGGNFMVDGHGTGFSSKLVLNENPGKTEAQIDTIVKKFNGITRYIKMNTLPYDQIHHIDMHMKLLDEETLLVGQYPPGVADGPQIEANLQYILNNFQTCFGKPYKVVRIPMPPRNGQYPPSGYYRTFTNSVIINKTVIVPTYEYQYDTTGLRIYREAMPGYNIVGIYCDSIIPSLGAIHCIVKEVGVNDPILISHSALRDTNNTSTPYKVKAYIKTKSGISNAKVYWTMDTTQGFSSVNMTASADTFTAYIPNKPLGTTIYYYISATSNTSKTITKPLPAPSGNFRFKIENSSGITGNNSLVKKYTLYQNYPNPFNPVTKIKFNLPKNGFVRIQVFDIAGRLINTLINDFKFSGSYEIAFNAGNLTSGVYFYKMETVDYSDVKKMLLIK